MYVRAMNSHVQTCVQSERPLQGAKGKVKCAISEAFVAKAGGLCKQARRWAAALTDCGEMQQQQHRPDIAHARTPPHAHAPHAAACWGPWTSGCEAQRRWDAQAGRPGTHHFVAAHDAVGHGQRSFGIHASTLPPRMRHVKWR